MSKLERDDLIPGLRRAYSQAIGRRLRTIEALCHCFEGELNMLNPLLVRLDFDGLDTGCIAGASDGETLAWQSENPGYLDMQEDGSFVPRDFLPHAGLQTNIIGSKLENVQLVWDTKYASDYPIGIWFDFDNDGYFSMVNWGDELFSFDKLGAVIMTEAKPKFTQLLG